MKKALKQLKKELLKKVGSPCKDNHPFCERCIVWRAFQVLEETDEMLSFYD